MKKYLELIRAKHWIKNILIFIPLLCSNEINRNNIIKIIPINLNLIVFVVLITIGLQMIVETFKNNRNISIMKFTELLIFGFAVSLDSFTVGLGLKTIYNNPLICAFIFSVCSALFTFLGLYLGKKINDLVGTISTLIGGIVLIIIGIIYLF